jgi:hypothetical protein
LQAELKTQLKELNSIFDEVNNDAAIWALPTKEQHPKALIAINNKALARGKP